MKADTSLNGHIIQLLLEGYDDGELVRYGVQILLEYLFAEHIT